MGNPRLLLRELPRRGNTQTLTQGIQGGLQRVLSEDQIPVAVHEAARQHGCTAVQFSRAQCPIGLVLGVEEHILHWVLFLAAPVDTNQLQMWKEHDRRVIPRSKQTML